MEGVGECFLTDSLLSVQKKGTGNKGGIAYEGHEND